MCYLAEGDAFPETDHIEQLLRTDLREVMEEIVARSVPAEYDHPTRLQPT